jgi:hypothetical protein
VAGYDPFSLCVIHKEGLWSSSGDINRLMMMMMMMNKNVNSYKVVEFVLEDEEQWYSIDNDEYMRDGTIN